MIHHIPGDIVAKGGTKTDILTLLDIDVDPLDIKNDGRSGSISAIVINGKQYALSDVLTAFVNKLSSISLATLPDVNVENPAEGDILVFDGEYWENTATTDDSEPSSPPVE